MMRRAVALSGGADSLCAAALMPPGQAFIVDHGLRAESAAEARQAAVVATALGHQPHIIPLQWHQTPHTQAHYRRARYRALALACQRHCIDQLWTGHHRDDQGETVLMRLERGSGLLGLSGMPYAQPFACAWLVRPLLLTSRAEIETWLRAQALRWAEDPSNADPKYPRTLARKALKARPAYSQQLNELALRLGALRNASLREASDLPIAHVEAGVLTLPRDGLSALSDAALGEVLRACVQWLGGQAYPALDKHQALVRSPQMGLRSTGGGVVMAAGRDFRLAVEGRGARSQSLEALGAQAQTTRTAQTKGGLWLPEGRATLPFVADKPIWRRLYASDKTPNPLNHLHPSPWIENLSALPI